MPDRNHRNGKRVCLQSCHFPDDSGGGKRFMIYLPFPCSPQICFLSLSFFLSFTFSISIQRTGKKMYKNHHDARGCGFHSGRESFSRDFQTWEKEKCLRVGYAMSDLRSLPVNWTSAERNCTRVQLTAIRLNTPLARCHSISPLSLAEEKICEMSGNTVATFKLLVTLKYDFDFFRNL